MCSKKDSLAPPGPLNTSASGDKSPIQNLAVIYGPLLIMKTAKQEDGGTMFPSWSTITQN